MHSDNDRACDALIEKTRRLHIAVAILGAALLATLIGMVSVHDWLPTNEARFIPTDNHNVTCDEFPSQVFIPECNGTIAGFENDVFPIPIGESIQAAAIALLVTIFGIFLSCVPIFLNRVRRCDEAPNDVQKVIGNHQVREIFTIISATCLVLSALQLFGDHASANHSRFPLLQIPAGGYLELYSRESIFISMRRCDVYGSAPKSDRLSFREECHGRLFKSINFISLPVLAVGLLNGVSGIIVFSVWTRFHYSISSTVRKYSLRATKVHPEAITVTNV